MATTQEKAVREQLEAVRPVRHFARHKLMFGKIKRLYFVGIGGAGMSGIAEVLHNLGYQISGSDSSPSEITTYLSSIGITLYDRHDGANVQNADVLVISSAVGEDNAEVIAARERGIPVIKRAEMLGELMRLKFSIGVAGTHGKTTTTSMIGAVMRKAELHPTLIVGGVVADLGTGASLGSGDYLVAEADEYDRSFLAMYPSMAVVTNLEADHLDCYDDLDDLINAFVTYMNRVPFYGSVVLSADDINLRRVHNEIARPYMTFGFSEEADYRAVDVTLQAGGSRFKVFHREDMLGQVILHVPGKHNISNALATIAACFELEVPFATIADGLSAFRGVGRRFDVIGEVDDIMVIDDYAHHPTEIAATLRTAKESYGRRVIVIYQPHLFSRTRDFTVQFAEALALADECVLVDIYPAREKPIPGVTSELIKDKAEGLGLGSFHYVGAKENSVEYVKKLARPGDMIFTMGAGSITLMKTKILEALKKR